jgi:hypothetical protein
MGQEIRIPDSEEGPIWAEVEIRPTFYYYLVAFFYKGSLPTVTVNGREHFLFLPSLAQSGFLLSPLVKDVIYFEQLAANPRGGIPVKSIRFEIEEDLHFHPEVHIRLFRLKIPPQKLFAARLFENSQDVRWRLPTAASPISEFTALEQVSISERQGEIVFRTDGAKASLLMPDFPLGNCSFLVAKIELTSPGATILYVTYETKNSHGYSPLRMVRNSLIPGRNTIFLAIPGPGLKGRLLLYPGSLQGEYVLHSLEVRGARP